MIAPLILGLLSCVLADPGAGPWQTGAPEDHLIDSQKLNEAFDYAFSHVLGSKTHCVSVHRNGVLVGERYSGIIPQVGDNHVAWSTSKAVTSTIIGIAEKAGLLSANDKVSKYVPEWNSSFGSPLQPDTKEITVDMLLRHDSGRWYDLITDFVRPQLSPSQTEFAIGLRQQHEPGTHYQYNQMAMQVNERVLSKATGEALNDYADKTLWSKIGAQFSPFYQSDSILTPRIDALPSDNEDPLTYGGVNIACRDLARFGQLWLQHGNWSGQTRIFEEEFYERGITEAPGDRPGRAYHWSTGTTHTATGMGGQFVSFNEEKNLIITRLGGPLGTTWSPGEFRDMVMDSLMDGKGAYSLEADLEETAIPKEELDFLKYVQENDLTLTGEEK